MSDQNPLDVEAIRARLDATSPGMTVDVHDGESTLRATANTTNRPGFVGAIGDLVETFTGGDIGPVTATFADDEDGQDATFALNAANDIRSLLDENARLNAELAEAPSRRDLLVAQEIMRSAELAQHKAEVELDRVIREAAAGKARLAAVRKIKPQRRNSAMVTSEQLATMRGWNDAVDEIRAAMEPCECGMTDPSTWETYGGATEPGSMYEWNPDCPAHGAEAIEETAQPGAGGPETPGTGSGRGTGVAEASGTAQVRDAYRPEYASTLLRLIDEAQTTTPFYRRPVIVQDDIITDAGFLRDAVVAVWNAVPQLLPSLPVPSTERPAQ